MSKSFLLGSSRQSWNLLLLAALATVIMPLANCIIIIIKDNSINSVWRFKYFHSKLHYTVKRNIPRRDFFLTILIREIYKLNYSLKKIKSDLWVMFGPTIGIKYEEACWVDSTNFPVGALISWRGCNKLQDNKI